MDWPLAYLQIIAGEWSRADKRRTRTWGHYTRRSENSKTYYHLSIDMKKPAA